MLINLNANSDSPTTINIDRVWYISESESTQEDEGTIYLLNFVFSDNSALNMKFESKEELTTYRKSLNEKMGAIPDTIEIKE